MMDSTKPADLILSEPVTILLDFQPDKTEFGRLHSARPDFLIATPAQYKSPFQYKIQRATEIHGYCEIEQHVIPASLLLFDVQLRSEALSRNRRIRKVKIEMEFKNLDSSDSSSGVKIIDTAPGSPAFWLSYSTEKRDKETEISALGGLNILSANFTGSWSIRRTATTDMHFWASIESISLPANDSPTANHVRWVFRENTSQRSAVPTDATLAVLLTSGSGGFVCEANIELHVDWVSELQNPLGYINLWHAQGKLPFPRSANIERHSDGMHDISFVKGDHLEKEINGLRKFVNIHMPKI
jgi:hypothetical protein